LLRTVCEITNKLDIEHYCSLEAYMACGIGVCHGCAVPIGHPEDWTFKRVCKEGPVFNAKEIRWELF